MWTAANRNRGKINVKSCISQQCSYALGSFYIASYKSVRPPVREILCGSMFISLTVTN